MVEIAHDVQCIALRQLETALRLYFEREDYYSVITLAGASEEMLAYLLLEKSMKDVDSALTDRPDDGGQSSPELLSVIKKYEKHRRELLSITSQFPQRPEESWTKNDSRLRSKSSKIYDKVVKAMNEMEDIADSSDGLQKGLTSVRLKSAMSGIKRALESLVTNVIIVEKQLPEKCGQEERPTESDVRRRANLIRNLLKHWRPGQPKVVEFDAQSEAKDMLNRAIDNYHSLTEELTPAMREFQEKTVTNNAQIRR